MHPRNIYLDSQRTIKYAEQNPYLATFIIQTEKGKKRLDFQQMNVNGLCELSKVLLHEDFNLDVDFPPQSLIPTIPLRLNYILWLEDLLDIIAPSKDDNSNMFHDTTKVKADTNMPKSSSGEVEISGVDIGTGASAIYALLAARKNNWQMLGTEINLESLVYARRNVRRNNLESNVRIKQGSLSNIFGVIFDEAKDKVFDFSMCNPPFFASEEESLSYREPRTESRPPPSNPRTGNNSELITEGGEVKFVSEMIKESLRFKDNIRLFTTMVGVKAHLAEFISLLKENGIDNFCVTEFAQGKTTRWGLAWSFNHKITNNYRIDNETSRILQSFKIKVTKPKKCKPLKVTILMKSDKCSLQGLVRTLFSFLKMELLRFTNEIVSSRVEMEYAAFENTWSHSRRRRREEKLREVKASNPHPLNSDDDATPSPVKRVKPNPEEQEEAKSGTNEMVENDNIHSEISESSTNSISHTSCTHTDKIPKLQFLVRVSHDTPSHCEVTLTYLDGPFGHEGLHQVFQYMLNSFRQHQDVNSCAVVK